MSLEFEEQNILDATDTKQKFQIAPTITGPEE